LRILTEPGRREEMGRAARCRAIDKFCSTKIIPLYEDLYRRVVEEKMPAEAAAV